MPGGGQRTAQEMIDLICSAPVFSVESTRVFVAEAGLNFPELYGDPEALVRSLGLTPGHSKSAGKLLATEAVKGNQHFKPIIVQAVTAFLRRPLSPEHPGWFLWRWGRRYQQRSDAQHARIAVARKITRSVFFMCRNWQPYDNSQHTRVQADHTLHTARRLANTAQELSTSDFLDLETTSHLKQASLAINQTLDIQVSRYKLRPFDRDFAVDTLDLSTRVVNILLKNDILSLSQLVLRLVSGTLFSLHGLGQKAVQEIEQSLIAQKIIDLQD